MKTKLNLIITLIQLLISLPQLMPKFLFYYRYLQEKIPVDMNENVDNIDKDKPNKICKQS